LKIEDQIRPPARRVTLEDVARLAGVSRAMVSIVIRDAPGGTRETRQRVLAAAETLGYRPDRRARSLASTTSRVIGVTFGVAGHFHFDLLEGLYSAADELGYDLILSAVTPKRDEQRALESLMDFRFGGLIMLGPPVAEPVMAGRMPVVLIGWHSEHEAVDVVRTSDELGMAQAVSHLFDLGHRRIAHLDGGTGLIANARREAYVRAMTDRGLRDGIEVLAGGEDWQDGYRVARDIVTATERPTAVIAYNDDSAAAALSVFAHEGIDVPGGISVIGWDDSQLSRTLDMTTVAQRPSEMARVAVERIAARCEGDEVPEREIILQPELLARSTTGPAPK
jgi:DNA-binding LacI/PurR family transcriptional regulator